MARKAIIIGSGIGGLALANLLAKDGFEVTVYEKNSQLGGRAGKITENGFTYDSGPSWYLMPGVFEKYFAEFGKDATKELTLARLNPAYKVFFDNHGPITIKGDVTADGDTFEAIEPGAGEALERYVERGDEIYKLALDHFLYTDFRDKAALLKPAILKRLGLLTRLLTRPVHSYVSSFVKTKELQQILEYPMVFLGTSPFQAPALYSLMSALDFKEGVYYPKRGMYSIIELLVEIGRSLGVTYHLNQEVQRIVHNNAGRAMGVARPDGTHDEASLVISNADLHFTETELLDLEVQTHPERTWKPRQSGISALLLYLGIKGELPQLEHHNLYFVDQWKENFTSIYKDKKIPEHASIYVSRTTATDPSTAPAGHENLFMLVPLPTGVDVSKDEAEKLADHYLGEFALAIGVEDLPSRVVSRSMRAPNDFHDLFHAWENTALGMSHILGQSALWRIPPYSKKLDNLYYVGAGTLPGIGLPMCLISAEVVRQSIKKREKNWS